MRIDISKIEELLLANGMQLVFEKLHPSKWEDDDEPIYKIYFLRNDNNSIIGKCKFKDQREDGYEAIFHIERIDIYGERDQRKGYGSLLLYATLAKIQELGGVCCTLTGFPINYSFYVRNGFCDLDSAKDMNRIEWYSLSLEEKKEILYKKQGIKEDRPTFFVDGEDQVSFDLNFKEDFAISMLNENINLLYKKFENEIYFYNKTKPISKFLNFSQNAYLHSRFCFYNGLVDGKEKFSADLKVMMDIDPKPTESNSHSP